MRPPLLTKSASPPCPIRLRWDMEAQQDAQKLGGMAPQESTEDMHPRRDVAKGAVDLTPDGGWIHIKAPAELADRSFPTYVGPHPTIAGRNFPDTLPVHIPHPN